MIQEQPCSGCLYVVATPIGNLADISLRALETLKTVSIIAAEDTRHSRKLLSFHGIDTRLMAVHEHNEAAQAAKLIERCQAGEDIALVSDAGTPLISDPGADVIRLAHEAGVKVIPIPGACAAIAALSGSGLPTDHFVFEGFLPARSARRRKRLQSLAAETRTMIFYEAVHRISAFLDELIVEFGPDRLACIARELSKKFETITRASLGELKQYLQDYPEQLRGEFVVIVAGTSQAQDAVQLDATTLLRYLLEEMAPAKAAALAAKITGISKNSLYEKALQLQAR